MAAGTGARAPLLPDSARQRLVGDLRKQGVIDERVLAAIGRIPRHEFVSEGMRWRAYENTALPIGQGQTSSQPLIVGIMTQLLMEAKPRRVLEIGTGCGYQAAVLAELAGNVFSVERIRALSLQARETLQRLGYGNVVCQHGDGTGGWPGHSPYDGIIVTAGAAQLPQALIGQLRAGGRLVMPLGDRGGQKLIVADKQADGRVQQRELQAVAFVPLLGGKA